MEFDFALLFNQEVVPVFNTNSPWTMTRFTTMTRIVIVMVVNCREFVDPSGARIVVDTVSLPYVKGSEVDWEDSLVRTGFVVSKNPNAAESCSCGTSFTAANANPYECIVCYMETFQKVVFLPFSRTFHTRGEEKNYLILISKWSSRAQLYCLEVKRT